MLIIALVFFVTVSSRLIQINKDVMNISDVDPSVFIDPNFAIAHANDLRTPLESAVMTVDFFSWMFATWGINVTAGTYNPYTTGYDLSIGSVFPTTVIDPTDVVVYDSARLIRGISKNWFVSASTWFVSFNTTFVVTSGTNAGALIDPFSVLIYGHNYYLRDGSNWTYAVNKETQLCYTQVTAKFLTNMFIGGGAFGGLDSVIRFTCEDPSSLSDPCFMSITNMYTRYADDTVDETKRSTVTC